MTSESPSSTRIRGSLRSEAGIGVVRIENRYDTDIDHLWSAITDPAHLARWYAKVEGDLRPGGKFRIFVESDDWGGTGRVEACEAPRRLVVTTRESDESWRKGQGVAPYDETLEAALAADGEGAVLVIEVKGMPLRAVAFYGAGWQIHAEKLAAYLTGREPGDSQPRWEELVPVYQALAAEIG
ncbi:MAG: SRPBCC domain-containing protein [Acidimicrobiales bacterium]|jgi:uncharacterized protein YndB with AHSA1/START domain